MRKAGAIATILAVAFSSGVALADDDCWAPMADWQPRQAVEKMAQKQGWNVRRITIHDGCYRVYGQDTKGRSIRVTLNPVTLKVLKGGEEDEHHNGHEGD